MEMKSKPNTTVVVTYHACTYNAVLAQYTDFTLTASTLSEKFSIRQILQDLVEFRCYGTAIILYHHTHPTAVPITTPVSDDVQ